MIRASAMAGLKRAGGPGRLAYQAYPCPVGFILGTMLLLIFLVGILVLVGHFYPGSGADLVDWKPTRSYEDEARLEAEDVQQMIDAQNEMRRRRGKPDLD